RPVRCEGALLCSENGHGGTLILLRCEADATKPTAGSKPSEVDELRQEVTHRKRSETIVSAQREGLRVILASIGDAVIATNRAGLVTFLNPAAEELTGWKLDEAAGQSVQNVFRILDETTGEPVENLIVEAMRAKERVSWSSPLILVSRDGSQRPIDESASPIRDRRGRI